LRPTRQQLGFEQDQLNVSGSPRLQRAQFTDPLQRWLRRLPSCRPARHADSASSQFSSSSETAIPIGSLVILAGVPIWPSR
jgi:hypothetical protein